MYRKFFHSIACLVLVLAFLLPGSTPVLAAPANDNFDYAEVVTSLPFSAVVDITEATTEPGEIVHCLGSSNTVWYSFTPSQDMLVQVSSSGGAITGNLNIYRDTGLGIEGLEYVNCAIFGESIHFSAVAETNYYIQVSGLFGGVGTVGLNLDEYIPPPPTADFYFWPDDPSKYDTVQFNNWSQDPAYIGFKSASWDFGDNTAASGDFVTHQYSADKDYSVKLDVTTWDGRTASVTKVVRVRTHDVAITKISAPKSASAGQIRELVVSLRNYSYAETVQVDIYRSVPGGGFEWFGSSKQFVPVRMGTRTTPFSFTYTFTPEDAAFGKVIFRATASLVNARDALPADNEMYSAPTKVTK